MNVVDSSGWLEYLVEGRNAAFFAPAIQDARHLIVPTLALYEVFRRVLQLRGESDALQAVALMQQGQVVELSGSLALAAAKLGIELRLPLADSIMLATARTHGATFWTQDADFESIAGVRYVASKPVGTREVAPGYKARSGRRRRTA